jgi:hypothetical protein
LNKEDINNLNRYVTSSEIETVIKTLLTKKSADPDRFNPELHKTFKELELLYNIQKEEILPNPFCEASITLIPKPSEDASKKENYMPTSLMIIDANLLSEILVN